MITCAPNFPGGKVFDGYRNRLWQEEVIDGIRVVRVWTFIRPNRGFALRIADFTSYMLAATIAAPFIRKADVVIATSPQFFTAVAGYMVSRMKRIPFIFEVRDLWPESIKAVGAMRDSAILRMLERLELFLYRKAARVIVVTNAFKRNLVQRGIGSEKIEVVTNGANMAELAPKRKNHKLMQELGLQGKFVSGYLGTLGMAHGLETVIEAARLLQERGQDEHRILFIGDGAERERLQALASKHHLRNIVFTGLVPREKIMDYWSLLDICIIHLKDTPTFRTVIPSKIFDAMATGIPMLIGVDGEARSIVEQHGCGIFFTPENAIELTGKLEEIRNTPPRLKEMSQACQRAAQHYDRTTLAHRMLKIIKTAVQ